MMVFGITHLWEFLFYSEYPNNLHGLRREKFRISVTNNKQPLILDSFDCAIL